MPLALTYTEGVLSPSVTLQLGKDITDAFLRWHNLSGNTVMTPNITMQIQSLPQSGSLSGGDIFSGAWLECKVPSFALSDRAVQEGFFAEATNLIEAASAHDLPRDRIYANAMHTVDGTWNMDGRAMTNAQLGTAIAAG